VLARLRHPNILPLQAHALITLVILIILITLITIKM
jgi:hypothetical protein